MSKPPYFDQACQCGMDILHAGGRLVADYNPFNDVKFSDLGERFANSPRIAGNMQRQNDGLQPPPMG